jgi:hypothetical protein
MKHNDETAARREHGPKRTRRNARKHVDDRLREYFEAPKKRALHDRDGLIGWLQLVFRG